MKITNDVRSLAICGGFGALAFVIMWALGSVLLLATGTPQVGGLASAIVSSFVVVIGVRLVPKTGAATIIALVMSAIAIPTIILGPPGVYKLAIGVAIGVLYDLILIITGRRKWGYILGIGITYAVSVPITYLLYVQLGLPAAEQLKKLMLVIAAVYFIEASIGSFLGYLFFDKKLANLARVKALLGEVNTDEK